MAVETEDRAGYNAPATLPCYSSKRYMPHKSAAKEGPYMPEQDNRDTLERLFRAFARHDVDAVADLHHDDHVAEYPQSGERIRGKDNWRKT